MMILPKFTNPEITFEELLVEQQRLHKQADKMLSATKLLGILGKFGSIQPISGSYDYDLMVYPDLDLGLVVIGLDKNNFSEIVGEVVGCDFVRKLSTADTVSFKPLHPGRPIGYWLGLEIPYEEDRWGIDCWIQRPEWLVNNKDAYKNRLSKISQAQREAILKIKYRLIHEGLYANKFYSNDVYDAVLDSNVLTYESFLALNENT